MHAVRLSFTPPHLHARIPQASISTSPVHTIQLLFLPKVFLFLSYIYPGRGASLRLSDHAYLNVCEFIPSSHVKRF